MAKVGSSSVYLSLRNVLGHGVFHLHSLSKIDAANALKACHEAGLYPGSRSPIWILHKYLLGTDQPVKIISLIRNPLERNISALFESFEFHTGKKISNGTSQIELEEVFYNKIKLDYPLNWFDNQFKEGTGIDVYQHDYDPSLQHSIIREGRFEVLLMDVALSDFKKEEIIASFCGLKNFKLTNVNLRSASDSGDKYASFKSSFRLKPLYMNRIFDSKYFKHFYGKSK